MPNISVGRDDVYASRCSLTGAAVGFGAGVLLVFGLLYFDVASLGSLLAHAAALMTPTDLLILPTAFAALGFAIGPSLAGEPLAEFDD